MGTSEQALHKRISELEQQLAEAQSQMLSEVTIKKQLEQALSESEERFSKAFNASPDAQVISHLVDGTILEVNGNFERLFGYSRTEVIGRSSLHLEMFSDPDDRQEVVCRLRKDGFVRSFEITIRDREGQEHPVSLSAEKININGEDFLLTILEDLTEHKRAEQALRDSEERYRVVLMNFPAIYAQTDRELRYRWVYNPLPDLDIEEVLGKRDDEIVDNDTARHLVELKQQVLESGVGLRQEISSPFSTRGRIYDMTIEPLRNTAGEIVGLTIAALDITFRKQSEEALSESERKHRELAEALEVERAKLAAAIDHLPVGVGIGDAGGNTLSLNPVGLKLHGFQTEAEMFSRLDRYIEEFELRYLDGNPMPVAEWPVSRALNGEFVRDYDLILHNRQTGQDCILSYSVEPIYNSRGELILLVYMIQDMSERIQVEAALRSSEARFRQLADSMPQLVWTARPDGVVDYYNRRYMEYAGIAPGEGESWQWAPVLHPQDVEPTVSAWTQAVETGEIYQIEHRVRMADGTFRWHLSRGLPVTDEGGKILKWYGTATDIHKQKEAEEKLKEYAARLERSNSDLEEFAFVASHDLQEPLRKIEAFGAALADSTSNLDEKQIDYIDRMRRAAGRMHTMVNDLLALSRVDRFTHPFTPTDLNLVLRDVLSLLEAQMKRTEALVEVESLPVVDADPFQMQQLFQNLIGNGLKFHRKEVRPEVKVVPGRVTKRMVEIRVEDNGIGFPQEEVERVFQPFQRLVGRSEYEGSGIGLAICRKIVERHGGSLTAYSRPGFGSVFVVQMPVKQVKLDEEP